MECVPRESTATIELHQSALTLRDFHFSFTFISLAFLLTLFSTVVIACLWWINLKTNNLKDFYNFKPKKRWFLKTWNNFQDKTCFIALFKRFLTASCSWIVMNLFTAFNDTTSVTCSTIILPRKKTCENFALRESE